MNMRFAAFLLILFSNFAQADVHDIREFSLQNYAGKIVYLDFWASWCKPCRKSFPWMNKLVKQYPADQFTVVTINLDEQQMDMLKFLDKMPADFDVFHDVSGYMAEKFQLKGMPTSYLINRKGKVVSEHIGFNESQKQKIEAEIESLL